MHLENVIQQERIQSSDLTGIYTNFGLITAIGNSPNFKAITLTAPKFHVR